MLLCFICAVKQDCRSHLLHHLSSVLSLCSLCCYIGLQVTSAVLQYIICPQCYLWCYIGLQVILSVLSIIAVCYLWC
ncbi:hypothetical protein GDO78_007386 [Eleutherodactylus coqui]|uniref:Uncharacterized protein n=1 Tax=Eleutherodactylus coqui TaxID=57060 RepID=A0A8J6FIX7_ELECQ|nr:hypothetical protein GDO78_007386 [Eleutherodactylus coqui]